MFQDALYQNISSAKSAPLIFPTLDPISVTTPAPGHGEGKVAVMSKRGHQHVEAFGAQHEGQLGFVLVPQKKFHT